MAANTFSLYCLELHSFNYCECIKQITIITRTQKEDNRYTLESTNGRHPVLIAILSSRIILLCYFSPIE